MAVSSISSDSSTLSLVDLLYDTQSNTSVFDSSETSTSSSALLSSLQSKKAQSAYGGGVTSSVGQAALTRALSEMETDGGKVTFSQIAQYREQLELEFTVNVRAALVQAGVSLDTEFSLNMGADGTISVSCDDPVAKEKIQKYLKANPKVCEQFGYIQALSNLERARQSPTAGLAIWQEVRNSKAELQTQAVEAFFNAATGNGMEYSSILASFSAGEEGTSFYTGLNFTV